jgi:hypothetical protein
MRSRLQWIALALALLLVAGSFLYFRVGIRGAWYPRSFAVALADVDGDGDLDAFMANGHTDDTGSKNAVWLNDGHGRFVDGGQCLDPSNWNSNKGDSRAVALQDIDGDGDLDAFVANLNGPNVVWLNDGHGCFVSNGQRLMRKRGANSHAAVHSVAVALGDLDSDGDLDAFVGNCCRSTGGFSIDRHGVTRPLHLVAQPYDTVWLNNGGAQGGTLGSFTDGGPFLGPTETRAVALGDLDGDGDLDAFVGNDDRQPNHVWLNDGLAQFTDSGQMLGDPYTYAVALGDLDGDGDLDAFAGNDGPNEVWLNDGAGGFTGSGQALGDAYTQVVDLADLDGDGDLDAFVGNSTTAKVWSNDGSGRFSDSGQDLTYSDRHVVTLGDVDDDGDLDVFAGSFDRGYRIWRNDGVGRFRRHSPGGSILYWLAGSGVVIIGSSLSGCWFARHRWQS